MAKSLAQIQAQLAKLQKQADSIRRREVSGVIRRIKVAIRAYDLTAADLGFESTKSPAGRNYDAATLKTTRGGRRIGNKAPIKYRDDQGNTWSGRGLQPRWLRAALAGGHKIEDFAV